MIELLHSIRSRAQGVEKSRINWTIFDVIHNESHSWTKDKHIDRHKLLSVQSIISHFFPIDRFQSISTIEPIKSLICALPSLSMLISRIDSSSYKKRCLFVIFSIFIMGISTACMLKQVRWEELTNTTIKYNWAFRRRATLTIGAVT